MLEDNEKVTSRFITKDHYHYGLIEMNENNFLSSEEKKQLDFYENYERFLNARYSSYFIKKSDFDKDKW